ncbi:hypothetical protein CRE_24499 [Caenorhabditis remanei]|uniref:Uncharacterized protein n=1 Tax=Caenorhabditis remanei TaxID=31234 RepID=E3MFY4_CAERE|nr:hypothetical protein CRE_24499 [Caenorhabditis remanei]
MNFLSLLSILFLTITLTSAQFFFPFGMGANSNGYNNYNGGGATYGSGYGVKDSEGYFAMCKGWTCQN